MMPALPFWGALLLVTGAAFVGSISTKAWLRFAATALPISVCIAAFFGGAAPEQIFALLLVSATAYFGFSSKFSRTGGE